MRTVDLNTLAPKIVSLYDDVMTYKTSQTIGEKCSKVFDITQHPSGVYDFSGNLDLQVFTGVPGPGGYGAGGKAFIITPQTRLNKYGPFELLISGDVGGINVKDLANYTTTSGISPGSSGMSASPYLPSQSAQIGYQMNIPLTRTVSTYGGTPMRYIKVGIKGSTANTSNHWVEVEAFTSASDVIMGTYSTESSNVAQGKTVTGQGGGTFSNLSYATNGTYSNPNQYCGASGNLYQTITIDLGKTYYIGEIWVWLYYGDSRTYYNFTVSTGTTNVSGTGNLADVWVDSINIKPTDYTWYGMPWYGGYAIHTCKANLKFTLRGLSDGLVKVETLPNSYIYNPGN